jgi:hypothetical protein
MAVDGALYEYGQGEAIGFQQKAHILTHLQAVFSVRGPQALAHALLPVLSARFATFEDLVDGISTAAWVVHESMRDELAGLYGNADVEVHLAGVGANGPEAYVVCSHGLYCEPWTRLQLGEFACAPFVEPSAETDIPAAMLDVMQRQRLERDEHGACGVGGHVQLVQCTAEAVHSAIIHRWPDQVGEPLGVVA